MTWLLINHLISAGIADPVQERVREIQHVVKSVVPVFSGDQPLPSKVSAVRESNGKQPSALRVGLFGVGSVSLMAAFLCAKAGVGHFTIVEDGDLVEQEVLARL